MSKNRVVVLKIIAGQLTVTQAAAEYGLSRRHLHRLLARFREEGLDGLEPRSRAPLSSPQQTTGRVRERIIALRQQLTASGADAGAATIAWHLAQEQLRAPSVSTIRRILHQAGLQTQLDAFRDYYNQHRPHRALEGRTPADAYTTTPKAVPASHDDTAHYRLRYDRGGTNGKTSFRRAARMHHLGIGTAHVGKCVLILADQDTTTVIHLDTGEIIATNTIDPDHTYWRNTMKAPSRWPGTLTQ